MILSVQRAIISSLISASGESITFMNIDFDEWLPHSILNRSCRLNETISSDSYGSTTHSIKKQARTFF